MPNRIIKESALDSEDLEKLGNFAERLFWRLILVADDYGRFDATPQVVKARCFPRRVDTLRTSEVEKAMTELTPSLVRFYIVNGRHYGCFLNWERHQGPPRAKKSKFPDPPPSSQQNQHDSICNHLLANAPRASDTDSHPNLNPNLNGKEGDYGGEKPRPPAIPDDTVLIGGLRYKWPSPEGLLALSLDPETWNKFVAYRREIRKPLTRHAEKLAGAKLADLWAQGQDLGAVIDQSIFNGWHGLFAVAKDQRNGGSKSDQQADKIQAARRRGL